MSDERLPAMSVIVVSLDRYETVRKTIRHLRAQNVSDRLEIVFVAPSAKDFGLDEAEVRAFFQYRVIEVGPITSTARAKAIGVRQACAPIVAFAEEHCYPDPDWAVALMTAHQQDCAAVGPIMRNANPNTMLSWAGLFLHFGCCLAPTNGRAAENLPWHNSSYKRQLLLDYGDELASLLVVEGTLLDDLRARGHRFYLEPTAKTYHVNISRLASWVKHAFLGGRLFGATRAQQKRWPLWRRLVYIGGSPLIPLVRLRRTLRLIRQQPLRRELMPCILPAVISGLLPHAVGEAIGYAFGLGRAEEYYARYEMTRIHHVSAEDRQIMLN